LTKFDPYEWSELTMNNPRRIQRHLVKALAAGALLAAAALPLAVATAASAATSPSLTSITFVPSGPGNTIAQGSSGTFTLTGVGFAGNGGTDTLTASGTLVTFSNDNETASTTTITGDYSVNGGAAATARNLSFTDAANSTPLTLANAFTVSAAPSISFESPDFLGVSQGATPVTITGAHFESGATVSFVSEDDGTSLKVGTSTLNADGTLTVSVTPVNAVSGAPATDSPTGSYDVTVTNPDGGSATDFGDFTIYPMTVSNVSPSTIANTTGSPSVTLTGSGFEFGAVVTGTCTTGTITFGASTFISPTSMSVHVTGGSASGVDCSVTVTNPPAVNPPAGIPPGNGAVFQLVDGLGVGIAAAVSPVITASSSTAATAIVPGSAGSTVTLTGVGFGNYSTAGVVFTDEAGVASNAIGGNGVTVTSCVSGSGGTTLTCVVTVGTGATAGVDSVSVDSSTSFANGLYVAGPSITSIAPAAMVVGTPVGTVFALTGTGFTNTMTGSVSDNASGTLNGIVQFVSATSANFVVTASPTTPDISSVANGSDSVTLSQVVAAGVNVSSPPFSLTVDGPPAVTSLVTFATAGTSGVGVGATAQGIVIHGVGFATGATVTAFTNTSGVADPNVTVTVTGVNTAGTAITATVAVAAGDTNTAVGYTVTNTDGGKAVVSAFQFPITIDAGPVITSVAPSTGLAGATTNFTLTGTGYTASSVVSISSNGSCGATTFVSATSLTVSCTLGVAQSTASNMIVTNPDGGTASTVILAAATPPPPKKPVPFRVIRVVGHAVVGRTVSVTIIGSGFHGQPHITSSAPGTRAIVSHDTGTRLTVRVTTRATTAPGVKTFTVSQGANHGKVHYSVVR
jgi:hypothetical protein